MARGILNTTIKGALNNFYKLCGVSLGKIIKEAHEGPGSSTRKVLSCGFNTTVAAEGLTAAATATHMVTPTLANGAAVLASAASATGGYSELYGSDNLAFDVDKNPFMEFKAKYTRDAASNVALECAMGLASANNTDPDATTYNAFFRFKDRVASIDTTAALGSATIAGTVYALITTSSSHGFAKKDYVYFADLATAATELNSTENVILDVPSATTFVIDVEYASLTSGTPSAGTATSLQVLCESDDNSTNTDDKATGYPVQGDTYYTFKIDVSNKTDIKFFIENERVKCGTTFTFGSYAGGVQPYFNLTKSTVSSTASVTIPYFRIEADA